MDNENKCNISGYSKGLQERLIKAIEFQQNMYELSSDWNYYEESEHEYLKNNIEYSFGGEPDEEDSSMTDQEKEKKLAEFKNKVDLVYQQICNASRTKKSLYVSVIFNVLCKTDKQYKKDKKNKKDEEKKPFVGLEPVFKVRRCMDREETQKCIKNGSTESKEIGQTALYPYCVYYVDSGGRTYTNWTDYVTENTLPQCIMVLPMGGFYQANPNASNTDTKTYAWIEIGPSPAATQILPHVDTASTVLGFGALGVGIAALAAPIAAPVLIAGSVCGAISGVYTTVRSGQQLVDRHKHKQSISVTDRTARSAWFGVVGGVAGGAASGSSFILTRAVRAGVAVGNVGRAAHNTITIGNIVVNGMGIGNGVFGIVQNFRENDEVSILEIGQVVAHVLFFGNAVMNFQTAKTIINNTQQQVIQDYESSLRSNRHKKAFKRITRNTRATNSDMMTADSEIIRGIRSIQNKDDFFAGVVRNRKVFSASKAEVTFRDGYAMINDNVKFDPVELSQQPQGVKASTVSAAEPLIKVQKSAFPQSIKMPTSEFNEQMSTITRILRPVIETAGIRLLINSAKYLGEMILDMQGFTKKDREELIVKLAELALRVVRENRSNITRSLEEIMQHIWHFFGKPKVDNILQDMGIDVSDVAKSCGLAGLIYDVTRGVINEMFDAVEKLLEHIIETFSKNSTICSICLGHVLSD